ncbi:MAG: hypothetical protein HY961_15570 [Ignavibacteriae bacterium]|nr:hypothetical protein [Ignavibacteriota bacterium]
MKSAFFTALLAFTSILFAQPTRVTDEDVLARIGSQTITARELIERLELMPWPGKENPATQDSARINAMLSLVAEKLLARDAADKGFVVNPENSSVLRGLERVLARDELYRSEIQRKTAVTDAEIRRGLERISDIRNVDSYLLNSEEHAQQLARALNAQRDSIKPPIPTAGIVSRDTLAISYGDVSREFENQVFALKKIGDARAVHNSQLGWIVLQLRDIAVNVASAKENIAQRRQSVVRKEKQRQEVEFTSRFKQSFFTEKLRMDSLGFNLFADSLLAIVRRDTAAHRVEGQFALRPEDIDLVKRSLSSTLDRTFIAMGESEISLGAFLDELRFHIVRFSSFRRAAFQQTLNRAIMDVAGIALLSQEAMRRRMHQRGAVQEDMRVWVEAIEAEGMLRRLVDSLAADLADDTLMTPQQKSAEAGDRISKYISRLAETNNVSIDFAKVKKLTVFPSNMVTRRFLGFGGAMLARPMMMRLWDWLEYWQKGKTVAP